MKRISLLLISMLFAIFLIAQTNPNHVWVNGYYRSSGTYVKGYWRTAPNHTNTDNFSTIGNTNPYTGKEGWIPSDNEVNPWKEDNKKEIIYEVKPYVKLKAINENLSNEGGGQQKRKHLNILQIHLQNPLNGIQKEIR